MCCWIVISFCIFSGLLLLIADVARLQRQDVVLQEVNHTAALKIQTTILYEDVSLRAMKASKEQSYDNERSHDNSRYISLDRLITPDSQETLVILDADGNLVDQSNSVGLRPFNFAKQDYFLVHKERTEVGLYISNPFPNPWNGTPSIALSRRLCGASNQFQGVVLAILPIGYLMHGIDVSPLGSPMALTLLRLSGGAIVRDSQANTDVNITRDDYRIYDGSDINTWGGWFDATGIQDRVRRSHFYKRMEEFPLIVDVATPTYGSQLMSLNEERLLLLMLLAICCVAGVILQRRPLYFF